MNISEKPILITINRAASSIKTSMQLKSTNYATNWKFKTKIQRFMPPAHHANHSPLLADRTGMMMTEKYCFLTFAEIVKECPPDFILVENVPGLNNGSGKEIYNEFLKILKKCEFSDVVADLLDAKHFGVPQTRKRFILLASKKGAISLPIPITDPSQFVTVKDRIEEYPEIADGGESEDYPNHKARELKSHHKLIVEAVPEDGGSRKDIVDTSILLQCHQDRPDAHRDVFGRMAWDKPAPTLTSRCSDVYSGRFTHPKQNRGISLREAAALQTFSDDYEFFGSSITGIARQIGNAVPVKLAEYLGKSILEGNAV